MGSSSSKTSKDDSTKKSKKSSKKGKSKRSTREPAHPRPSQDSSLFEAQGELTRPSDRQAYGEWKAKAERDRKATGIMPVARARRAAFDARHPRVTHTAPSSSTPSPDNATPQSVEDVDRSRLSVPKRQRKKKEKGKATMPEESSTQGESSRR